MLNISQQIKTELLKLNQRKLERGEIFLLAKAISDEIPLAPQDTENINLYILTHKSTIDSILYEFNYYTYLEDETIKIIYKLISELSLWRLNIAYNPPFILFKCDENAVIDDISCLPRYIDLAYMTSVADIVDNANYIYSLFRNFAKEIIFFLNKEGN